MGQNLDSIVQFLQYAVKVLPELKRLDPVLASQSDCPAQIRKSTLTFILSLYNLSYALEACRADMGLSSEAEIRKLYGCLSCAVDPSRSTSCFFGNPQKALGSHTGESSRPPCMSDQCRLQLAVMPSFSLVSTKLKKYIQLYIDFQTYGNLPGEHRMDALRTWSETYLMRYREISFMEFCAATGSLLGIVAMYASAADPGLTANELSLLDEACFPWLCGLESLLRAFVDQRAAGGSSSPDFLSPYQNLKDCEQRLSFFVEKTEHAFARLKESKFYLSLLRTLLGMYLSNPEADFGLTRLASRNILKKGPRQSVFFCNTCKFLRFCRATI